LKGLEDEGSAHQRGREKRTERFGVMNIQGMSQNHVAIDDVKFHQNGEPLFTAAMTPMTIRTMTTMIPNEAIRPMSWKAC
jgi:hypothetical protein